MIKMEHQIPVADHVHPHVVVDLIPNGICCVGFLISHHENISFSSLVLVGSAVQSFRGFIGCALSPRRGQCRRTNESFG